MARCRMSQVFHYFSGEAVELGDRVRDTGHLGRVVEIIAPGSEEAIACECQGGGVRIVVDWDGQASNRLYEPRDGPYWEDLEFLGRQTS